MTLCPKRRYLLISLALALCTGSAQAAGGGSEKTAAEPAVRLASVGIPVMQGNRVVNYLFISVRINLTPAASETKLRELEPMFRDALVRTSHRVSFGKPDRSDQLDEPRFKTEMLKAFTQVAGPGMIKSVDVLAQSPKKFLG